MEAKWRKGKKVRTLFEEMYGCGYRISVIRKHLKVGNEGFYDAQGCAADSLKRRHMVNKKMLAEVEKSVLLYQKREALIE